MNAERRTSKRRQAVVALLMGLLVGYAVLAYYGFGPYPREAPVPWWQPRGFFTESLLLAPFGEDPLPPILAYTLPAVGLALAVMVATRSALVSTAALTVTLATSLFLFYGLRWPGPQIWSFFGWRGGAVMVAVAAIVSAALLSPLLAASWLKRGWALRLLIYAPLVVLVACVASSATGTNPALRFNLTPWPVATVFGFDLSAAIIAALLASSGLALAALRWRERALWIAALGLTVAVAVPVTWTVLRLPSGLWMLAATLTVAALALRIAASAAGNLTMGVRSLAGYVALGSILVATPLLLGSAWRRMDYSATREGRAQKLIDALAIYYEHEDSYPDTLAELVEARYLDQVPKPRVGIPALNNDGFTYQNLGSDYLLEFASPGWTQCHYSPPWDEDLDEDYEDGEDYADDPDTFGPTGGGIELPEQGDESYDGPLPGQWSCPAKPPELW